MDMKVTTTWQGKRHFQSSGPSGHSVSIDAKEEAGGEDKGSRPMELLLMGLTGCTGIDIAMILERMRLSVANMHIEATGARQDEYPQKFTEIDLIYHIDGEVPANKAWRAIHLSEEKYCSASASLSATIRPRLVLNGEETPDGNDGSDSNNGSDSNDDE